MVDVIPKFNRVCIQNFTKKEILEYLDQLKNEINDSPFSGFHLKMDITDQKIETNLLLLSKESLTIRVGKSNNIYNYRVKLKTTENDIEMVDLNINADVIAARTELEKLKPDRSVEWIMPL